MVTGRVAMVTGRVAMVTGRLAMVTGRVAMVAGSLHPTLPLPSLCLCLGTALQASGWWDEGRQMCRAKRAIGFSVLCTYMKPVCLTARRPTTCPSRPPGRHSHSAMHVYIVQHRCF